VLRPALLILPSARIMWVDKQGRRRVPYKKGDAGIFTPSWELPVTKSNYVLDESDEEVQRTPLYSPPKRRPEENGFYMPNSPFAKIAEEDGLDFNADKSGSPALVAGGAAQIAQAANDVFDEHHKGRRWAEKLALMSKKTGAFRPLVGVKLPIGGYDEDGVDLHIADNKINAAKERAKTEMRVQARRLYDFRNTPGGLSFKSDKTPTPSAKKFAEEKKRINQELLATIGKPNLPVKRMQNGGPELAASGNLMAQLDAVAPDSPLHGL
jgi:hypothetical protein